MNIIYQKSSNIDIIYTTDYYYYDRKYRIVKGTVLNGGVNKNIQEIKKSTHYENIDDDGDEIFEMEL